MAGPCITVHYHALPWQDRALPCTTMAGPCITVHYCGRTVHYRALPCTSVALPCSPTVHSAWKSGLKTAKRPQPDRTKTGKRPDCSPVFWLLRFQDRKKTGLNEPV